jgi:ketosteroid isomerase-like protein
MNRESRMPNAPTDMDVVQTYERLMRENDEDGAMACLDDDFRMFEPESLPYGGVFRGRDGFARFRKIFVSLWSDVDRGDWVYAANDGIVARRATVRAVARATGRSVEWPHAEFFTVRETKIATLEVFYFDTAAILAALGRADPGREE